MSTYRPIERNRHSDERVMDVGPIARAVWDYLCCNKQDHTSGLYSLSVAAACEDTGWTSEQFEGALGELEGVGLIEMDRKRRLVWVRNMLRKAYPKGISEKQRTGIEKHLNSMPRSALIARLVAYYATRYGFHLEVEVEPQTLPPSSPNPSETLPSATGNPSERVPSGSVRLGSDRSGSDRSGSDRSGSEQAASPAQARAAGIKTTEAAQAEKTKRLGEATTWLHEWSMSRPPSCRAWGLRYETEAAAECIRVYGLNTCQRVVDDVGRRVCSGDLDAEEWSKLWAKDGQIFGIRLAEIERAGGAQPRRVPTRDEALAHLAANGKPPQGWVYDADANLVPEHGA